MDLWMNSLGLFMKRLDSPVWDFIYSELVCILDSAVERGMYVQNFPLSPCVILL